MSTTTLHDEMRPASDLLRQLSAGLGFESDRFDGQLDLTIDRFDEWTNPRGAVLACTCVSHGPESMRAA
jgi:hypothetical protein